MCKINSFCACEVQQVPFINCVMSCCLFSFAELINSDFKLDIVMYTFEGLFEAIFCSDL